MNRFRKTGIGATCALAALAGSVWAADMQDRSCGLGKNGGGAITDNHSMPNGVSARPQMACTSAPYSRTNHLIRDWKGGRIDVVPVDRLDDASLKATLEQQAERLPQQVATLHKAIEDNSALARRFAASHIPIGKIVDAEPSAGGVFTFYVR